MQHKQTALGQALILFVKCTVENVRYETYALKLSVNTLHEGSLASELHT